MEYREPLFVYKRKGETMSVQSMILDQITERKKSFPERNLLVAMLERALLDYFGNQTIEKDEAEEWLFDDGATEDEDFSFPWICAHLELDRERVLDRLLEMKPTGQISAGHWWGIRRHA